eukprot:CAMPEP_0194359262 /NCGR_PEP_ID=MMETSP0174-20130528/6530_1 /TAXON_ID=216777 /ORGANISM="Proboscia alata, Strain PI-D3" /LENGTH=538 /DNA_ID=CAMNT_0039130065 /DNA_START=92 /DNA_END=1708 /DNA_ORIENTATION=+
MMMKVAFAAFMAIMSVPEASVDAFGVVSPTQASPKAFTSSSLKMSTIAPPKTALENKISAEHPLRVVIAGAGVGGLVLAHTLQNNPKIDVTVLEKTDQFKRFGGPIQLASNALRVLDEMCDKKVYDSIMSKFTFTGDKENGIKDGIRDEWYAKFDLAGPAEARGMPYTGVIERPDLQEIFLGSLAKDTVQNGDGIAGYEVAPNGAVKVQMESGNTVEGDVLIGADGIWSAVRAKMRDEPLRGEGSGVSYSGYSVFAGELDYASFDNGKVGYKVYIGPGQYFVITDIGKGRYQWYAFLAREPGSAATEEKPDGTSPFLQNIFTGWSKDIHHILKATKEDEIDQRDLYDRPPSVLKDWSNGPVALLGDAVHAMMPNLGQGGCQAIEDSFVLKQELEGLTTRSEVTDSLKEYKSRRLVRSAAVQGLSRFASDIIIRGFDTPAKIVDGRFENFNYAGIVTRMLQPILPVFFVIQFNFLYEGWRNDLVIDFKAFLGLSLVGGLILLLGAGSVGEAGILGSLGLETIFGGEGLEALFGGFTNVL